MKNLCLIFLILGCNSQTITPIHKVDTLYIKDTTVFKMAARSQLDISQINLNLVELSHMVDSLVSWKMSQNSSQDLITIRKNQAFFLTEIEDLQKDKDSLRLSLRVAVDSLSRFKGTYYKNAIVDKSGYMDTVTIIINK